MKFETKSKSNKFAMRLDKKATLENLVELEHEVLEYWDNLNLMDKVMDKNRNGPTFSFLDGPITANNPMGVHHAWGRTIKDVVQRYKAMHGFKQRYQNGFDTQGLWLEVEVEKSLGLNSKRELETFGLDKFAEKCKLRINKYSKIQTQQSVRLGQNMDWQNSYYTHTDENVSAIWHFLKYCHNKGWLYKSQKPMPWCWRCGTSLSQHEQADAYKQVTHKAVFVKCYVPSENYSLLIWTTTPWTLPANTAVAVNPTLTYAKFQREKGQVLVASVELQKTLLKGWKVLEVFQGDRLVGLKYQRLFDGLDKNTAEFKPVVAWEDVSQDEGTGLVHLAPGCGEDDFQLSKSNVLDVVSPLDDGGYYTSGFGAFSKCFYQDVNQLVQDDLKTRGLLFNTENYRHRYPHCWRCKNELVYRTAEEWFLSTEELKPQLKEAARSVKWTPSHVGKLFQNWLDNMGDWCISRKRYWGLPLPFYPCSCGYLNVLSSKDELFQRALGDVSQVKELHRPWVDTVQVACGNCGHPVDRVTEVGDCWLDAGVTPFSTLNYFNDKSHWEKWFPADFVCEMREQVRLWFYSTMFMSVALTGLVPFKQVVAYEKVHDSKGEPMHKSTGNAVWFDDAVEEVGADALRLFYLDQNLGQIMKFNYQDPRLLARSLLTLWNVLKFLKPLAKLDGYYYPDCVKTKNYDSELVFEPRHLLDKWVLSRLDTLRSALVESFDTYKFNNFLPEFLDFVNDLSNWYLRRSRKRFWAEGQSNDKLSAYNTLTYVLTEVSKLLAPLTPFFAEFLYQNMKSFGTATKASVHLEEFPGFYRQLDEKLEMQMDRVLELVRLVHSTRSTAQVRVRQPLYSLHLVVNDAEFRDFVKDFKRELMDEVNVKKLFFTDTLKKYTTVKVTLNYKKLGVKYGNKLKDLERQFKSLTDNLEEFYYSPESVVKVGEFELDKSEIRFQLSGSAGYELCKTDGLSFVLRTKLTSKLEKEGVVREVLRHIQLERQKKDLDLNQRVLVEFKVDQTLRQVLEEARKTLCDESQATKLVFDPDLKAVNRFQVNFKDSELQVSFRLVAS